MAAPMEPSEDDLEDLDRVWLQLESMEGVEGVLDIEVCVHPHVFGEEVRSELTWNYMTNTVQVWMDGGFVPGCATAGVHFGPECFNDKILVVRGKLSYMGELTAVLIALQWIPEGCNVEVVTDCTSVIHTLSNFSKWKRGQQADMEGRSVVWQILDMTDKHKSAGHMVSYVYIPSHISEKQARYKKEGGEGLEKWTAKLGAIMEWHRADSNSLHKGNEATDTLATTARSKPNVMYNCGVTASTNNIALMHTDGSLTEHNLHSSTIKEEADQYREVQQQQPSRGEYLQDPDTNYLVSVGFFKGGEGSHICKWMHSTRFKSQNPNAEKIHHYWDRDKAAPTKWYMRENPREGKDAREWEVNKVLHCTSKCHMCTNNLPCEGGATLMVHTPAPEKKEMHEHVYLDCKATTLLREERDGEV
jgi:ribonuclease HI